MQAEGAESMPQGEPQSLRHVALARVRRADPIAEERALSRPAHDLVEVDRPQDRSVAHATDQELVVAATFPAVDPLGEERGRSPVFRRQRLPGPEERRTTTAQRHVLVGITARGAAEEDSPPRLKRPTGPCPSRYAQSLPERIALVIGSSREGNLRLLWSRSPHAPCLQPRASRRAP